MRFRLVRLLRYCRGDESYAHGIAYQAHDVVNLEPLHDLAAMAFDRLDAEPQALRDFARAMSFRDESEDLDLASRELV